MSNIPSTKSGGKDPARFTALAVTSSTTVQLAAASVLKNMNRLCWISRKGKKNTSWPRLCKGGRSNNLPRFKQRGERALRHFFVPFHFLGTDPAAQADRPHPSARRGRAAFIFFFPVFKWKHRLCCIWIFSCRVCCLYTTAAAALALMPGRKYPPQGDPSSVSLPAPHGAASSLPGQQDAKEMQRCSQHPASTTTGNKPLCTHVLQWSISQGVTRGPHTEHHLTEGMYLC